MQFKGSVELTSCTKCNTARRGNYSFPFFVVTARGTHLFKVTYLSFVLKILIRKFLRPNIRSESPSDTIQVLPADTIAQSAWKRRSRTTVFCFIIFFSLSRLTKQREGGFLQTYEADEPAMEFSFHPFIVRHAFVNYDIFAHADFAYERWALKPWTITAVRNSSPPPLLSPLSTLCVNTKIRHFAILGRVLVVVLILFKFIDSILRENK